MKILVTGANGFIGKALIRSLIADNDVLVAAIRQFDPSLPSSIQQFIISDFLSNSDWELALSDIDIVIHLAARVHVMNGTDFDPLTKFRRVNTVATLNLSRQAANKGVSRFIYLSSIKVNGEETFKNSHFTPEDSYIPTDPYALSKYEAEEGLREIAVETGMEVVIIRPPLVYGANVKANFESMMGYLYKSIPLPLGAIDNQRSLIALDNLNDFITTCIDHPAAPNQTFLVSDDEDLSTTELLHRMAKALGKPARLIPLSSRFLTIGATLLGKQEMAQRLCSSLQVDISHTKNILDWKPPISVDAALQKTADAYLKQHNKK